MSALVGVQRASEQVERTTEYRIFVEPARVQDANEKQDRA